MARPKFGIALGSGAARGLAHVGVLRVLAEHQIPVDVITGSSAGAVIAALFAAGFPIPRMIEAAESLSIAKLARPTLSKRGLSSSIAVEQLVIDLVGDLDFRDLKIPLTVVATDLRSGREVYLDSGRVARAVRASAGFVGVYSPVEIGGVLLVDGGVAMAAPVGAARAMGADYVAAVDVIPAFVFDEFPGNIFSIVSRTLDVLIKRAETPSLESADFVLEPLSGDIGSFEFDRAERLVELGEIAAMKALHMIRETLGLTPAAVEPAPALPLIPARPSGSEET